MIDPKVPAHYERPDHESNKHNNNAMDCGRARATSIKLAAQDSGQWVVIARADDARECDGIVNGLADLLAPQTVRPLRRTREFVTETYFPSLEVASSALPKSSQVSRAVGWANV
jgi:hypothetical protein